MRIVTRQSLDRLRALGRRKEYCVGPWLPEPLVLETLTPTERAVFVLREVSESEYDDIDEAVGKTPAAVRQIAHRARAHAAARRPRGTFSPAETRAALRPSNGRSRPATRGACST